MNDTVLEQTMDTNRRDWLRSVGSLVLAVGVAGCSSGSNGGSGGDGGTNSNDTTATTDSSTTTSSGGSTDSGTGTESSNGTSSPKTPGKNPAATDTKGSVASDKQAEGLSFVEHYHYEMNGVQGVGGKLKNDSGKEFAELTVHATVQPGDAGPYAKTLSGSLPAGETRRFQFGFGDDVPSSVESYTVWATGTR